MPTSCFSLHHVDAFAAAPFTGNPAAVLTVPLGPSGAPQLDAAAMQAIAAELNLSETAFIAPLAGSPTADDNDKASPFSSNAAFSLRWFTPSNEVKLCGHATLAAAHVLFKHYANAHACIDFHTLSGVLRVGRSSDGSASAGGLRMQFPANVASTRESALDGSADPAAAAIIQAALGSCLASPAAAALGFTALPQLIQGVYFSGATGKLIVRLVDAAWTLLPTAVAPDVAAMHAVPQSDANGPRITGVSITVAAPPPGAVAAAVASGAVPAARLRALSATPGAHFLSRYFSPWNGIPEDPVNGSSHTILAPLWAELLGAWEVTPEGKRAALTGVMLSARGGVLRVQAELEGAGAAGVGASAPGRVYLEGTVVDVYAGQLRL